jgi:hypothetical protein
MYQQQEQYWGNVNRIGVRSVCDQAKRAAASYLMAHRHSHGLETRIARIFTHGRIMCGDDSRAERELRWRPQVQLEDGPARSSSWWRRHVADTPRTAAAAPMGGSAGGC